MSTETTETASPSPEAVQGATEDPQAGAEVETKEPETTPDPVEAGDDTPTEAQEPETDPEEEYSERVQKRIAKLTAKQREAEREAEKEREDKEYWRQQALKSQEKTPETTQPTDIAQEPREENFETYGDYIRALTAYQAEQHYQQQEQRRLAQEAQVALDRKLAKGREKYPDFAIVFKPLAQGGPRVTPVMREIVAESDYTADIAYYLAKNPDVSDGIASLSPHAAARAIGKIEAQIEAGTIKLTPKTTTKAPPPIAETVGVNQAGAPKDPDKLTIKEWMDKFN